jgi:hypothetical protein
MRVKTIGRGQGGHPCGPNPYLSWLSGIKTLKLINCCRSKKSDSGDCIDHASVTPRNTEYAKYNPPGAQVSDDALTQKYLLYTPPSRQKRKIWVRKAGIHRRIFSLRNISFVTLILSLIISKQRVPSSMLLLLTEEAPLLVF